MTTSGQPYATTQAPGPSDAAACPPVGPGATPVDASAVLAEADAILGGQLPTLGMVIRDAERLGAQMLDVLGRDIDPASAPTVIAWPALSDDILVHQLLLADAAQHVNAALRKLSKLAELPMPPVGSAVRTTRVGPGGGLLPGLAAAAGHTACESNGEPLLLGAGASSDPSPHRSERASDDHRRGVGPGVLGPVPSGHDPDFCGCTVCYARRSSW